MPLTFDTIPGVAGAALVAARAAHDVTATGPSAVLATMIPEFAAIPTAGVPNSFRFRFPCIAWLLLAIVKLDATINRGTLIVAIMIHVNRLGVALEDCIAGGLNVGPCSASVARKRLRRKAAELFAVNPGPYLALAADLYQMVMPPPAPPPVAGAAVVAVAAANSPTAAAATVGLAQNADGWLLPLADAEVVMFPRFTLGDRVAGSGCDFFYEPWVVSLTAGLAAPMVNAIPPLDLATQIWKRYKAHLADEMLATIMDPIEARIAHVAAYAGPVALNASNAAVALQHNPVLLQTITIDTPGPEILRMFGTIIQAVLGNVPTVLANVGLAETHVTIMLDRMLRPDAIALVPNDRVNLLVSEHKTAEDRRAGAPRDGDTSEKASGGYARVYDQSLNVKLHSAAFLADAAAIQAHFTNGSHPYVIIFEIFNSCEIIFWHALLERKNVLPGVPLVERIATELRSFGPTYLGDAAMQAILPRLPPGAPPRNPQTPAFA